LSFLMESYSSPLAKGLLVLLPRWLGPAWAACMVGGCLIPQDDTLLAGLPQRRNRPPRIVEMQVQPPERIIRDFGAEGLCELDFSVVVEDPDVDDLLTVRWYLDYDDQDPTGPYREFQLANNGEPQRGDRATLRINLRAANSPLSAPGDHLVEAVVSDTRLVGREPVPVGRIDLADGGAIINPGYVVTHAWFVTTVRGDCP
jgi:hypothetical protein